MINESAIKSVAESALRSANRTSLSSNDGFSDKEIKAIASAIIKAIDAYDEQKSNQ